MSVLITGAAGFIGSNFLRYFRGVYDGHIVSFDALTYAGNLENIQGIPSDNHIFIRGTITDQSKLLNIMTKYDINTVIHFAAESHVDRSIMSSDPFIQTNVVGTQRLLDASKEHGINRFIHISTDEVYGTLEIADPPFNESHQIQPNSPYAASKASSDLLVRSYIETFNFPAIITRCSNNYGPFQFPEKLIPLMINNAKQKQPLPVYGDGSNIRDWIHVNDHCKAIETVLNKGELGAVYNIGGMCELSNIEIVKKIIHYTNAEPSLITYVKDRPGHDFRYAMDISKITNELGWTPQETFDSGLEQTIEWYSTNTSWMERIINGEYKDFYKEQYL